MKWHTSFIDTKRSHIYCW